MGCMSKITTYLCKLGKMLVPLGDTIIDFGDEFLVQVKYSLLALFVYKQPDGMGVQLTMEIESEMVLVAGYFLHRIFVIPHSCPCFEHNLACTFIYPGMNQILRIVFLT